MNGRGQKDPRLLLKGGLLHGLAIGLVAHDTRLAHLQEHFVSLLHLSVVASIAVRVVRAVVEVETTPHYLSVQGRLCGHKVKKIDLVALTLHSSCHAFVARASTSTSKVQRLFLLSALLLKFCVIVLRECLVDLLDHLHDSFLFGFQHINNVTSLFLLQLLHRLPISE